jgi:hypothetical protein
MSQRPANVQPPAHWIRSEPPPQPQPAAEQVESGGPKGEEPTRYGDWENHGRCWDF